MILKVIEAPSGSLAQGLAPSPALNLNSDQTSTF